MTIRIPGVRDVAARAGVSRGTVSNVLNHPQRVKPETLAKVQRAIGELSFVPDDNARSLTVGHNNVIGLILPGLLSSFFVELARGAQHAAHEAGVNLLIADSDDDDERQAGYIEYFDSTRARGILIAPTHDPTPGIDRAMSRGRSVVVVNYAEPQLDCCSVMIDEEQAGYLAARHLIEIGCRSIAWVGGLYGYQPIGRRRLGALRAIEEESNPPSWEEIEAHGVTAAHGEDVGRALAQREASQRPDGIITATTALGVTIMRQLQAGGIHVPGEVAIVASEENTDVVTPDAPLSGVGSPGMLAGRQAVALLLMESDTGSRHHHATHVIQPELIERASTRR